MRGCDSVVLANGICWDPDMGSAWVPRVGAGEMRHIRSRTDGARDPILGGVGDDIDLCLLI